MKNELTGWYVASVEAPVVERVSKHVYQGWQPCLCWCREQFGSDTKTSNAGDGWRFIGEGVFEFREERHLAWFLLRWT